MNNELDIKKIHFSSVPARFNAVHYSQLSWLRNYVEVRSSADEIPENERHKKLKEYLDLLGKNGSDIANRYRGCMLGLAVGDALGTTLEFSTRKIAESHTEMQGGGPFSLEKGYWTDDTSMALCLAYSLLDQQSCYLEHQMMLYRLWWKQGLFSPTGHCFDIGNTVQLALNHYEKTGKYLTPFTSDEYAGNGSLMRLAPVVLFAASSDPILEAERSSQTTHGNIQSVDACRYFAALIIGALKGCSKAEILSPLYSPPNIFGQSHWSAQPLCSQIQSIAEGSYKQKTREEIQSTGYVVHSLEAALWAFYSTETFEAGMVRAVNLGGDADTIGAIYGQLAGAFYGESAIPFQRWIFPLYNFHWFYYIADEMLSYFHGFSGPRPFIAR